MIAHKRTENLGQVGVVKTVQWLSLKLDGEAAALCDPVAVVLVVRWLNLTRTCCGEKVAGGTLEGRA
jgi:hypothetical protein